MEKIIFVYGLWCLLGLWSSILKLTEFNSKLMSGLDSNDRIFEDIWALWHKGLLDCIEEETDSMIYGPGMSAWFPTYKQSFNLGTT